MITVLFSLETIEHVGCFCTQLVTVMALFCYWVLRVTICILWKRLWQCIGHSRLLYGQLYILHSYRGSYIPFLVSYRGLTWLVSYSGSYIPLPPLKCLLCGLGTRILGLFFFFFNITGFAFFIKLFFKLVVGFAVYEEVRYWIYTVAVCAYIVGPYFYII